MDSAFKAWGLEHVLWLFTGALYTLVVVYFGRRLTTDGAKRRLGLWMSLPAVAVWILTSLKIALYDRPYNLELVLPFHVCYLLNFLLPVMLWRQSFVIFEYAYCIVMAGCVQALLTPTADTVYPDLMSFRYFMVHCGLITCIIYAVSVYGFRPDWSSLWKSMAALNGYFIFAGGINAALGTNFMFICRKPDRPTLLDLFGEWPWYLLGAELLALSLFSVVLLPFVWKRKSPTGGTAGRASYRQTKNQSVE